MLAMLVLALMMVQFPVAAWATDAHANGLHIALESDRDSYGPGDLATFTLSATNQGDQAFQAANYELSLPENMVPRNPSSIESDLGSLAPSETKTVQVSATVVDGASAMLVPTGDDDLIWTVLFMTLVCMLLLVFALHGREEAPVTFRKVPRRPDRAHTAGKPKRSGQNLNRAGHAALSIIVAFGLFGFAPIAGVSQAYADESAQSVRVSHTVNIAENEHEVVASFSFSGERAGAAGVSDAVESTGIDSSITDFSGDTGHAGLPQPPFSPGDDDSGVAYQAGVFEVKDYKVEDGLFLVDLTQYPLKEGDRAVFLPTDEYPCGAAGSLTSVVAEDGTTAAVSLEQARSLSDIFERVKIEEAGVRADFDELELADGVELIDEDFASTAAVEKGKMSSLMVKVPLSDTVDAVVEFTPELGISVDWTLWSGFKRFDIGLSNEMEISVEGELFSIPKSIPILKKPLPIYTDGFTCVGIMPSLKVKLDGKLSFQYEIVSSVDVSYKDGDFRTTSSVTSDLDAELEAKGSVALAPYISATYLNIELADLELDVGLEAKASIVDRPTGMRCVDLKANAFMNLTCGENTGWMKTLHVTFKRKLITADNCPEWCKWSFHSEDGEVVPACTYDDDEDDEGNDQAGGNSSGGGTRGDGKDGIVPPLKDNGFGTRPEWTYNEDNKHYSLVEDFNVNAGTKLMISGDKWFTFDYVTDYDRDTDESQGTLFKMSWTFPDGESDSAYYGNTIGGGSPVGPGEVTIEVLYGRITIFSMRCYEDLPAFVWDTCEPIDCPLHISASNISLGVDDTYQLECWQDVSSYQEDITDVNDLPSWNDVWTTDNADIAWVDRSGLVHGVSPGATTITCNYYGFQRSCTVVVK